MKFRGDGGSRTLRSGTVSFIVIEHPTFWSQLLEMNFACNAAHAACIPDCRLFRLSPRLSGASCLYVFGISNRASLRDYCADGGT